MTTEPTLIEVCQKALSVTYLDAAHPWRDDEVVLDSLTGTEFGALLVLLDKEAALVARGPHATAAR